MIYIHLKEPSAYVSIGSDIPSFLFAKNCIITGIGEKISPTTFPKFYFLLIKPNFNNSTKEMYEKLDIKNNHENSDDSGNDFDGTNILARYATPDYDYGDFGTLKTLHFKD